MRGRRKRYLRARPDPLRQPPPDARVRQGPARNGLEVPDERYSIPHIPNLVLWAHERRRPGGGGIVQLPQQIITEGGEYIETEGGEPIVTE